MISALALMLISVVFYFPWRYRQTIMKAYTRQATQTAELIATAISRALNEHDFQLLQKALQSAQIDANVLFLLLEDESGEQVATYKPHAIPISHSASPQASTPQTLVIRQNVMDAEDRPLGCLTLGYNLTDLQQQIDEYCIATFAFTLISFFLGFIFIHKVSQRLTNPISQLHQQMEDIIKGNTEKEVQIVAQDEVGRLSAVFNQMMSELRLRHQSLAESQRKYRELYEKLQELYNLRSIFVSDVSHHLRTPLTVINGQVEVTLRQERKVEEYKEVLQIITEETKHLSKIVDSLLTLAKADAGNLVFLQEEVDLSEICQHLLKQACLLANDKGIQFEHEIENNCLLRGDPNRLAELISNLIENAVKYTPPGNSIKVALKNTPDKIIFTVIDTGIGIPPEETNKIFDRFYRGKNTPPKSKGAGLGLAICHSIVKAHGGTIEVLSQVGKGSTFQVTLPRQVAQNSLTTL